ncbi:unnamed protein product [Paramecium sonneborni]|uniref:Uncharacterized protein n=1 Tax=Paramecium sonneborni TaxID=65129 RepID=A0A8S1MPH4_9CILI|nr:unnamed protein product [Paramecium sonneborni]
MMKIKKEKIQRSKYKSISSDERELIIQYIEQYKYSSSHVSIITGHNISTIKAIYQVYKREGRIQKKQKRDKILKITSQVLFFVADDMKESFVKLGEDIKEFLDVKDDNTDIRDFKENMLKQQLINNKSRIFCQLVNQQAKNNFLEEMNIMIKQNALTKEFSTINPNTVPKFQESQQINNRKQEKCSYLTQIPQSENPSFYSQVQNKLYEQHALMKT